MMMMIPFVKLGYPVVDKGRIFSFCIFLGQIINGAKVLIGHVRDSSKINQYLAIDENRYIFSFLNSYNPIS